MTSPRISIAMATYNGARFIAEQLQSFSTQTLLPDELIVADDGSNDDTLAIVERFAATAPFAVHIHRNPARLGYSANFSRAVSLCRGAILFLSDQDDTWFEPKIERSVEAIDDGAAVVLNDQTILLPDGRTAGTVLSNARALGFPDRIFVAGSCTAMTAEFAELALPFPAEIAYDNWVSILADLLNVRTIIEHPLQLYRRHEGNVTAPIFAEERPTVFGLARRHGLSNPRMAWLAEINHLQCYADRIEQRRELAERLAGATHVDSALYEIHRQQRQYRCRLDLIYLPRVKRVAPIFRLWQNGFYSHFSGWKSAIKDLIRS